MSSVRRKSVVGTLSALVVAMVLLATIPSATALGSIDLGGPYFGCVGDTVTFRAVPSGSPPLVFFRFDLNGDGRWDVPAGGLVGWDTVTTVNYRYGAPFTGKAKVEAWDGVSVVGGKPAIVSDVADVSIVQDTQPPSSAFVFPVDGTIYTVLEFILGQDGLPGTGDDSKFLGTATDPAPSCGGIEEEHLAVQRQSDSLYYDASTMDFTSASVVWNPAAITSGYGTSSITWEFFFPAGNFPDDVYQASARATDHAGNVESTAKARFFVTHADGLAGMVPGSASCGVKACSFVIASPGALALNGASVSIEAGMARVVKAREGPEAFLIPLTPGTRVTCTSGATTCVYGIVDHFVTVKGTGKTLVSTGVVSLHDPWGIVGATGSGGGAFRFLRAVADGSHFEGSASRRGPDAVDGSGTNLLYLALPGDTVNVSFIGSECTRTLEPGSRTVTRFHTVQGITTCRGR